MRLNPVLVLIVLTLSLPIPVMAQSAAPAPSPIPPSGDFAGLVDISGRSLYLGRHGEGSPTVRAKLSRVDHDRFFPEQATTVPNDPPPRFPFWTESTVHSTLSY